MYRPFAKRRARAQAELEAREDFQTEVLSRLARIEAIVAPVDTTPEEFNAAATVELIMQQAADHNREHAAEKFPDVLFSRDGEWYETASGLPVVFTPHGWRVYQDVKGFMPDTVVPYPADHVMSNDEQIDFGGWEDR